MISGTSTGGLMTAMLAAPDSPDSNQPLFTPSEVVKFYKKYGPEIFKSRYNYQAHEDWVNILIKTVWDMLDHDNWILNLEV